MTEIVQPSAARWTRTLSDAHLVGVCGALARGCGLPVALVRIVILTGFVSIIASIPLALTAGVPGPTIMVFAGLASATLFTYVIAWFSLPLDESAERDLLRELSTAPLRGRPALAGAALALRSPVSQLLQWLLIAALVGASTMLAVLGIGTTIDVTRDTWPSLSATIGLAAMGVSLGVLPLGQVDRARWGGQLLRLPAASGAAVMISLLLLLTGALGTVLVLFSPRALFFALGVSITIIALLLAVTVPWLQRLWRGLRDESEQRALVQQRAEITAHLHDSVLQTLASIQQAGRSADSMKQLARVQESELRRWLYGTPGTAASGATLRDQVQAMADELQAEHGVAVDAVVVGDAPNADAFTALCKALREALSNAIRHGGTGVSVFMDASPSLVEAFVRDRGPGINLDQIPSDRLGVRESIIGRMERAGGTARVGPAPGGGTKVALSLAAEN